MRRSTPPTHDRACAALHAQKTIDETAENVLAELAQRGVFQRGSKRKGVVPWEVELSLHADGPLQANLRADRATILRFDWHRRPSRDGRGGTIPSGYHVDVYLPFVQDASKVWLESPIQDRRAALDLLCRAWNICLVPSPNQGSLL